MCGHPVVGGNVAHFVTITSQPGATSGGLCCEATIKAFERNLSNIWCIS